MPAGDEREWAVRGEQDAPGVRLDEVAGPERRGHGNEQPDAKLIKDNMDQLLEAMPVIDEKLGKTAFLAGDQFTLADLWRRQSTRIVLCLLLT